AGVDANRLLHFFAYRLSLAGDPDSTDLRGFQGGQNYIPLTKGRRGPRIFNSDALGIAPVIRKDPQGQTEIHSGVPFSTIKTLATVFYQNQETAFVLPLPARDLRQSVTPGWCAA